MAGDTQYSIRFTAPETATLAAEPLAGAKPAPTQVAGRALFSLVSAGTELSAYRGLWGRFPSGSGYACVFEVDAVGAEVTDLAPGSLVFCMGPHQLRQLHERTAVLPLPEGLAPEYAPFARLMGVTQATLVTTKARPPARVVVTGLGLVGNLGAQVFSTCGYDVTACDPDPSRRALASKVGITRVLDRVPLEELEGRVDLVLECSGHEAAAMDGCRVVRKGGEVVLTGTPWERHTDQTAHEVLHTVFYRYVVLRSGWEWQVPQQATDFRPGSLFGNFAAALTWLREGRVRTEGLAELRSPRDPQSVYEDLLHKRCRALTFLLDWRGM
jgi:threonine dehydrogenase-like Zn-dependent dehydrogenase